MDSFRKSRNNRRGRNFRKGKYITDQSRNDRKCYECGKYGHIANRAVTDLDRFFSDFQNLQTEKRNLEVKLEVGEVEKDLLYEEIHELKFVLQNSLNKSNSSKISSKKVSSNKNSSNGNYFSCNQSYKSIDSRTNSNDSISE
ncbi:hypothetical protein H5410_037330 [Solanum commersonii]|uniref:CCHC-type domain-containing protein n=1 Tax=Solanum commersonii TaxID=4109 RepID=A0A9J5Y7Q0_SOLCO|nr:hypothetical protein H5410_037330 [Solanum commersonii]